MKWFNQLVVHEAFRAIILAQECFKVFLRYSLTKDTGER